jgi:hypothetical protein
VQGFARREFALMLLRRMADFQPELVIEAYGELEATHSRYMAAHNRWQSLLRSRRAPRGLALYRAVLGPPDGTEPRRVGDVTVTACAWRLPGLWPDLCWEAVVGHDDVVLHGWLVRARGEAVPAMPDPARLAPWSCVVGDVLHRFPDAIQVDPEVYSQWLVRLGSHELWFVHGLLQDVRLRTGVDRPVDPAGPAG